MTEFSIKCIIQTNKHNLEAKIVRDVQHQGTIINKTTILKLDKTSILYTTHTHDKVNVTKTHNFVTATSRKK